ncbi:hypothetical protein AB4Z29_17890 [Paenibacillus sp. 2TAB23]
MHCLEEDELKELFNIDENLVLVMMIALGKSAPNSFRPRGYRKPINEFVRYFT